MKVGYIVDGNKPYPIDESNFIECYPIRGQRIAKGRHFGFIAKHKLSSCHWDDRLSLVAPDHQIRRHSDEEVLVGRNLSYALLANFM